MYSRTFTLLEAVKDFVFAVRTKVCRLCVSFRSECGQALCSLSEGGLTLCVQPGVCERRRGLGPE